MTQSINTSNAVIVVGDRDTAQRADLAEKAAEQGAVIAEIYTFELGEAASHHDLAEVEAVVTALSRAIGTRTDVWVPFPLQDLCREQHIRRLSLVLQRHGLNLLMGRELAPCPVDGGYNEIDMALRAEVRAVDSLDHAAMATAGVLVLSDEIELALAEAGAQSEAPAIQTADEQPSRPDRRRGEVLQHQRGGEVLRQVGPVGLLGDARGDLHLPRRFDHRADPHRQGRAASFHPPGPARHGPVVLPARHFE